VVTRACEHLLQ